MADVSVRTDKHGVVQVGDTVVRFPLIAVYDHVITAAELAAFLERGPQEGDPGLVSLYEADDPTWWDRYDEAHRDG